MSLLCRSVLVAALLACAFHQAILAGLAGGRDIKIEVVSAANHRSLKGARVFVLSEAGKELASASTDEHGIASLPALDEGERPKYVIVEHPAFFLSGMRWQPGLREYYILMTVLTAR